MSTETIHPRGFHGILISKGLESAFVEFCKREPRLHEITAWCIQQGIPKDKIPNEFRLLRKKLGCGGKHGGHRPGSGGRGLRPTLKN